MSDQPKHTPGPWFAKRTGGVGYFEWYVGRDGENYPIAEDIADPMTRDQSEANAHLIAAAPDLLEALKAATSFPLSDSWVPAALAAIAKAEGRGA